MISNCARVFKRGLDHLSLSGRRQKSLINDLLYRSNRSQKSNQVYALPNQFFFMDHRRSFSSLHLFDMSSRGGGDCSGHYRSVKGCGTRLVKASPVSTGRQSTPTDDNDDDDDTSRLSIQHSQIVPTSLLGIMYVYRTKSGLWEFANSDSTSRTICDMLKERITSFWPLFSKVPSHVKDHWFEEFKNLYEWNPSTSFVDVRRLWERKCSLKHRQIVSTMKRYNMSYTGLTDEVCLQFLEHWKREDVKELARKISANRKHIPKKNRYGYRVMTQLVNDMKKEIGRTPTYMEAYIRLHYVKKSDVSKDTEWINVYLEKHFMMYNKRVAQVSELLGRELYRYELNRLFIHFSWVRDMLTSLSITHEPNIGNIPEIHKDNTYNVRFAVLDDREKLVEVQKVTDKVDKLEKKISFCDREMPMEVQAGEENYFHDREMLMEVRELRDKVDKLEKKISLLK